MLVVASSRGRFISRTRIELVDADLPPMPHHHEAQKLPLREGVALVERVRASAERRALEALAAVDAHGIALRVCPPLPPTIEERIRDYRAMCVADWVMYRQALASAAGARGWSVSWFDPKRVFDDESISALVATTGKALGSPWNKDHKLAMAAAIASPRTSVTP